MSQVEPRLNDLIDRVVDGCLSPTQLREAVKRFDASPDGWRRCALAFIEAQALADAFRQMENAQQSTRETLPFPRRTLPIRHFAYAASLALLAFGLGWIGHRAGWAVDRGLTFGARLGEGFPGATGGTPPVPTAQSQHTGRVRPVPPEEELSLRVDTNDPTSTEPPTEHHLAEQQAEIPLEEWLRNQPPPLSAYDQAALEREGYRVEQSRDVVFGSLDDGRLAAVPVDKLQVEYVGHMPL